MVTQMPKYYDLEPYVLYTFTQKYANEYARGWCKAIKRIMADPPIDVAEVMYRAWIPVSEKLPETTDPVNITWVNRNPNNYYAEIKDVPFTATGHYCDGRWYWFSTLCQDYLDEYGYCNHDLIDDAVEVTAWMPMPKPYEENGDD